MRNQRLTKVISELRSKIEGVPKPLRLPSVAEVESIETELGLKFSHDYKRYLLEASDVTFGTLEPATITDPEYFTYLPEVIANARSYGVPADLLPICEDNGDFYCQRPSGEVMFWSHNGATEESWADLAIWIQEVWIEEHA